MSIKAIVCSLIICSSILGTSCTKHTICTCEHERGYRVQIDLSQCYDVNRCEDLNEFVEYDNCNIR